MEYLINLDISHIMKKFNSCLVLMISIIICLTSCVSVKDIPASERDIIWEISYRVNTVDYTIRLNGTDTSFYSIYSTIGLHILVVYLDKENTTAIHYFKSKDEIKVLYFNKVCRIKQP